MRDLLQKLFLDGELVTTDEQACRFLRSLELEKPAPRISVTDIEGNKRQTLAHVDGLRIVVAEEPIIEDDHNNTKRISYNNNLNNSIISERQSNSSRRNSIDNMTFFGMQNQFQQNLGNNNNDLPNINGGSSQQLLRSSGIYCIFQRKF